MSTSTTLNLAAAIDVERQVTPMVAITEETTKQDTRDEWITFKDEWETSDSEDDEAVSHDQPEVILNGRDEWQTEGA